MTTPHHTAIPSKESFMSVQHASVSPAFLRRPDAAKYIGMSEGWLRKIDASGKGPEKARCGKSPVYSIESLNRFMRANVEK
jgi:hypothetical protein